MRRPRRDTLAGMPHERPESADQATRWLLELTSLPTAAGREGRVVAWIERWASVRPDFTLTRDAAGNLLLRESGSARGDGPELLLTAHLDHPAFVVENVVHEGTISCTFRGGVMDPYFENARIVVHTRDDRRLPGTVLDATAADPLRRCTVELDSHVDFAAVRPGDVGTWDLPDAVLVEGEVRAPACDDLSAVAAILSALEALRASRDGRPPVSALFTRAEEVGFIGAIAACREGVIPEGARVLALENSRAYPESPLHAGPIVRVGDKTSTFSPTLTAAVAGVADGLARQTAERDAPFRWQRRLMPGGTCEATCFCAFGHEATCVCLPLKNYHNMGNLDAVSGGDRSAAVIEPEAISLSDYLHLVELLVACAWRLESAQPLRALMDKLYAERSFVLRD